LIETGFVSFIKIESKSDPFYIIITENHPPDEPYINGPVNGRSGTYK
jgi:hypothetical protein